MAKALTDEGYAEKVTVREAVKKVDDRGFFVTIIHASHSGFWLSQCSRSLQWRNSKNKGEQQHGEISFLTITSLKDH